MAAKEKSERFEPDRKQLAETADTILRTGGKLGVAYTCYRATVIETAADVRFDRCDFEGQMNAGRGYEQHLTEHSRAFCWCVHDLIEFVLTHRESLFANLLALATEGDLLALVGASWGEFLSLSETLGIKVPASELLRVNGLTVLPSSEQMDRLLSCTMRLAGLLSYAADAADSVHSNAPGNLGGMPILCGDRHGASD